MHVASVASTAAQPQLTCFRKLHFRRPRVVLKASTNMDSGACSSSACPFTSCARPGIASSIATAYQDIGPWPTAPNYLPVVYHEKYNITFFGIERFHPFDSGKFRKVRGALQEEGLLPAGQEVRPTEASRDVLLDVHTPEYINLIHSSNLKIVQVTELPPLMALPNKLLQWKVVSPMKHHVAGTMLAAGLALAHGWAINLGGGMHHAYTSNGMGWCPFDDIMLAVRRLRAASHGAVQKVLVVDLDAHQGNGVSRDKLSFKDSDLFIVDIFNGRVFPQDDEALPGVDVAVALKSGAGDEEYLPKLEQALQKAQDSFQPDLIVYNAGTDVLAGDPLGRLAVSHQGILTRDEMVWSFALQRRVPIVMLLSGGYARNNAAVITASLKNLFVKFNLSSSKDQSQAQPATVTGV